MGKINVGRVFLGGLVLGVVILVGDVILGLVLPPLLRAFGAPQLAPLTVTSAVLVALITLLVGGPAGIWFYAAIRPRFGPGPKTATYVALWSWLIMGPYMQTGLTLMGYPNPYPFGLWVVVDAIALPVFIIAVLAGARVYQEEEEGAAKAAAAD